MYDAAGTSNPVVMTRNLKKMAGKLPQKPLRNLLGHGYQDGNEAEMLRGASGAGLNLDSGLFRSTQGKCYTFGDFNQLNICSTSNLLDIKGQANLLLQPKACGKCIYLKITDFCDDIIQRDFEKVVAQNGVTNLAFFFELERRKLEDISVYQYMSLHQYVFSVFW